VVVQFENTTLRSRFSNWSIQGIGRRGEPFSDIHIVLYILQNSSQFGGNLRTMLDIGADTIHIFGIRKKPRC
jgi:hypothetical protein